MIDERLPIRRRDAIAGLPAPDGPERHAGAKQLKEPLSASICNDLLMASHGCIDALCVRTVQAPFVSTRAV